MCQIGKTGCLNTFNPLHSCSEKNFAVSHSLPKGSPPSSVNILCGSEGGNRPCDCVGALSGFPVCVINQCYENRTSHASLPCCFSYNPSPGTNSIKQ